MKKRDPVTDAIRLARFWFTVLWEPRKLLKQVERPSYLMMLLNVLVPSVAVSAFAIFVLAGGPSAVDLWAYGKTIIVSTIKYAGIAVVFALGAVSGGKGSLHRMACFASFPITGYLLLVDSALLIGNPVAGVPIAIVLKSLLVLFAVAMAGVAHHEAKMKWWKAGVWVVAVLAVADYLAPYLGTLL